jgi:hypothetical protein
MSKKNVKKIIDEINDGIIQKKDNEISSGDETEKDDDDITKNTEKEKEDNWKDSVKKYTKLDEKIREKKSQKLKIMKEMKKKFDMTEFNEQIKELNEQKIKLESNLIKFLEKTGDSEPVINLGSWGTLKLCESKKKTPLKPDLIEKTIDKIVTKRKIFDSKTKKDKFLEEIMEQLDNNRSIGKKYLKKVKGSE